MLVGMPEALLVGGQALEQAARDDVLNADQARVGLVAVCRMRKADIEMYGRWVYGAHKFRMRHGGQPESRVVLITCAAGFFTLMSEVMW